MNILNKIIGSLIIITISFIIGYIKGSSTEKAKFELYKKEIRIASDVQKVKNELIETTGLKINEQVENDYAKGHTILSKLYAIDGLQNHYDSCESAKISGTSGSSDERSAHVSISTGSSSSSAHTCAILRHDAAITTRQYLFLRDWVEQQKQIWNKK